MPPPIADSGISEAFTFSDGVDEAAGGDDSSSGCGSPDDFASGCRSSGGHGSSRDWREGNWGEMNEEDQCDTSQVINDLKFKISERYNGELGRKLGLRIEGDRRMKA